MNNRSRALLNLAHRVKQCQNCGQWQEHGCDPAHQNGQDSGKGIGIKGQDNRHAALGNLCCHRWLDQGSGTDPSGRYPGTREGKREMWMQAHLRTFDLYWQQGWVITA